MRGPTRITSRLWQTNAVLLRAGETTVLVDSPVLPDELAALPRPDVLLVTHAHFDHVLARAAFPDLPLLAGPSTLVAFAEGSWEAELRESDDELYVERDRRPDLTGAEEQALFEAVEADGHAADGSAFLVSEHALLLPGDYLMEVEIPLVSRAGSPERYLATLDRLAPLVRRAEVVQPGHGPPVDRRRALELLELDRRYVADLAAGPTRGPRSHRQQRIHEDNVAKHG